VSLADTVTSLTKNVADLYKEIVTTSVRFEDLRQNTDQAIERFQRIVESTVVKVLDIHDTHVREKATLEAGLRTLEGRLDALSEQALHAVARETARDLMRENLEAKS
jgi:tetrahydromethanopterin S-methyltransferase subunit A